MKKIVSSLFLFVFLSFVLSSCVTFDGYYYDLEKARSQKNVIKIRIIFSQKILTKRLLILLSKNMFCILLKLKSRTKRGITNIK